MSFYLFIYFNRAQNITGGLHLGGEKASASEAENNTCLNAADETENVEQGT